MIKPPKWAARSARRISAALIISWSPALAQVLTVALPVNPTSLDPQRAIEGYSLMITNQVYETLLRLGEDGGVAPGLVEAWEVVTPTVVRFSLRPGVRFHDGSPLTASTVAASLARMVDPATASRGAFLLAAIERVDVLDDLTLDIVTSEPHTPLLANLTFPATAIVPITADEHLARAPVGTGPFRFVAWRDGDVVELARNTEHWAGEPPLTGVRFRVMPDRSAQVIALRSGEVDLIHDLPADTLASLQAEDGIEVVVYPSDRTTYLGINHAHPLLSDPRVRSAIAHALDRDLLVDALLSGLALSPRGMVAPLVRYSLDEADRYSYDPELARSLLAQAGAKGAVLRLDVGTDSGLDTVAQYVQASLNEVGLDVELRRHEFAVLFQLASSGRTELTIIYSGSDTLDPDFLLSALHSTRGARSVAAGYSFPDVDAMLDRAAALPNGPVRADAYRELQERLLDDLPLLPLYHHVGVYAKRNDLTAEMVVGSSFQMDLREAQLPSDPGGR